MYAVGGRLQSVWGGGGAEAALAADPPPDGVITRPLDVRHGRIDMSHGSGGRSMVQLIEQIFLSAFDNPALAARDEKLSRSLIAIDLRAAEAALFARDQEAFDDAVKAGQMVARVDATEARARLKQAQAQASVAVNQTRYATLLADSDGVVTAVLAEAGQDTLADCFMQTVFLGELDDARRRYEHRIDGAQLFVTGGSVHRQCRLQRFVHRQHLLDVDQPFIAEKLAAEGSSFAEYDKKQK